MPLHHYLPASFLARFSDDVTTEPSRNRILFVGDKKNKRVFKAPANKVGCIQNLYTLIDSSSSPDDIDQTWTSYEKNLPSAINNLINKIIDVETWARVLVPFVACMLIRVPDFNVKFNQRWPPDFPAKMHDILSNDNANHARLMELQRLLGFVATAKWLILTTHGEEKLITNDLGFSPFINSKFKDVGMVIPLDHKTILAVVPTIVDHPVLREEDNKWVPIINFIDLPTNDHQGLNKSLAHSALRFVFGSQNGIIQRYINENIPESRSPEPEELGFPGGRFSRAHEFTWHRLVAAIKKPPSEKDGWDFPLDIDALASGWHSLLMFPINLVEFPPALKKIGNTIQTRFFDPEPYYALSHLQMLEQAGQHDAIIQDATTALLINKIPSSIKARILGIRAGSFADTGNFKDALKDIRRAISLDSSNINLLVNLGYTFLKAGNNEEAYRTLSRAIKRDPKHGVAYSNRAITLLKLGRRKEALADSSTAINLIPDSIERAGAFLNRGNILRELGQEQQAADDLEQAEKLFKKFSLKGQKNTLSLLT